MFVPQNPLEHSLLQAATDPSCRPQFYRDLLASDIYVITTADNSLDIQNGVLQQESTIGLQPWLRDGEPWIPVFTALIRLQQNLQSQSHYVCLNAKSFFEITRGANVVLNPNEDYGKEFLAAEIEGMLDGSLFHANRGYRVEKETQVMVGQPAEYPTALVNALCRLFRTKPKVKSAYLAQIFHPERGEPPHTLIGVVAAGDWESVVGDAGMVAQETMAKHDIVDFVRVSSDDVGVSQYLLRETKPIYQRSFLRGLFG